MIFLWNHCNLRSSSSLYNQGRYIVSGPWVYFNSYRHADFVNCMHVLANLPAFRRKIFSCTLRLILDKIEIIIPYFILFLRYKKEILSKYDSKKKLARSWKLTSKFFRGEYWIKIVFWGGVKTKWIKILSRIFSRRSFKFKTAVINKISFFYEVRHFFQKKVVESKFLKMMLFAICTKYCRHAYRNKQQYWLLL